MIKINRELTVPSLWCKPAVDTQILYSEWIATLNGNMAFRSLELPNDIETIHYWVNQTYSRRFWQMNGSREMLEDTYHKILLNPQIHSYIGLFNGKPVCQVDLYLVIADQLKNHLLATPFDCGLHFLMMPPTGSTKGLSRIALQTFCKFYFSFPQSHHLFAEPDEQNEKANLLARKSGFHFIKKIVLPEKIANLYQITRNDLTPHNK